jgi:chemotaxis protein methyltransferase WspC
MQRIEQRLRQVMGLDASSIGTSSLQRTIRLRMQAAGAASVDEYERMVNTSASEWNQLIEAVVITETWFFRDRQAFNALANMLLLDWLPAHATGQARILSLPCSSGEEPYSIVMTLLDAGVPPGRFRVEGVDLSERALAKAAGGTYGKNSFRGQDLSFRERHFKPAGDAFAIKQSIRDCVNFRQANLLSDSFTLDHARYDFIFCRNLLIYFDRVTQQQAFQKLESLLAPGGTLFVGPAEVPLAHTHGYGSVNLPMAFACRRSGAGATGKRTVPLPPRARPVTTVPVAHPPLQPGPKTSVATAASAPENPLDAARKLADGGKLEEAVQLCHRHLDRHGASTQAFYLLGVIHDAQGHPAAREFYRKALYLDPNHYESLLQLALLAEKEGDETTARNLRRRAQRQQDGAHRVA